jgi:hypothetical protein
MSNLKSGNFPLLTYRNINVGVTGAVVKAYPGGILNTTSTTTARQSFI